MAHRRHAESPSVCHLTQAISAPHFAMDTCVHVRMVAPHNSHITWKDHKSFSMQPTNTCTPSFSLHSAFWSLLCPNMHQMHPDFLTYLVLGFSENHSQKIRPPGVKHMGDLHLFKLSLIFLRRASIWLGEDWGPAVWDLLCGVSMLISFMVQ